MIDGDAVVVSKRAEDLPIVGDGVVQTAGHLEGLAFLLFDELENVLFGLLHVRGLASDLDLRACGAGDGLLGDVDTDAELGFEVTAGFATTANEKAVFFGRDFDVLSHLAVTAVNEGFDGFDDPVGDALVGFDADSVVAGVGTWKADHTCQLLAVIGAASFDNNVANVRA